MGKKSSSTTTSDKSQHNFDPLPAEFRRAFTGLYRPLAHRHGQLPGIKWASQKSWRYWKQFKTARLRSPVACPWNASGLPLERFRMTGTFLGKRASMEWWLFQYAFMGCVEVWKDRRYHVGKLWLKSSPSLGALLADLFEFGPRLIEKVSGPKSLCLACIVW